MIATVQPGEVDLDPRAFEPPPGLVDERAHHADQVVVEGSSLLLDEAGQFCVAVSGLLCEEPCEISPPWNRPPSRSSRGTACPSIAWTSETRSTSVSFGASRLIIMYRP